MNVEKVQKNKIYRNNSFLFIAPLLNNLDEHVGRALKSIIKLGYFIGNKEVTNEIYILVDTYGMYNMHHDCYDSIPSYRRIFSESLIELKKSVYYKNDFIVGDLAEGNLHVLVFNIPQDFKESIKHMLNGDFSKMFTRHQIDALFVPTSGEYKLLTKDVEYGKQYIKELNEEFNSTLSMDDVQEYHKVPTLEQELLLY